MKYIHLSFVLVLAIAGAVLGYYLTTGDSVFWRMFYYVYLTLAIGHIWYTMLMLAKEDLRPRKYPHYNGEAFAVVIPCYNETPELLRACIKSAHEAAGNKEIILVNDGSTNGIETTMEELWQEYPITLLTFPQNRGKREGLAAALAYLSEDIEYAIFTDSDTLFDRYAFTRMVASLKQENVGGVAGDVRIINENENWLTKMSGAYYWTAFNIGRRSQSALGQVSCCSGALAGYRTDILRTIRPAFRSQKFAGATCTYGEDRHITNLVLEQGYDVVYREDAVAYTDAPTGFRQFLKQQLRWRRGFVQEAAYGLTFLWRVKPVLFFEVLVWEIITPYLGAAVIALMFIEMIADPTIIPMFLFTLAYISLVRHLPILFYAPGKVWHMFVFTFYSFFVSYWQGIHALFTVRKKAWSTR